MKSIPKEYNSIVASTFVALLLCGASGYFLFDSLTLKENALLDLEKVSSGIKELQSKPASPTDAYLNELREQKKTLTEKIEELRNQMRQIDIAPPEITAEDFPKSLTAKVLAFRKRAEKESVQIPADFNLGFDEYQTKGKIPPKNLASYMGRQLEAVDLLLNTLLETQPLELRSFQRKTPDEPPDFLVKTQAPANPAPPAPAGPAKKNDESKKTAPPLKASLWAETYQLEFTNRPERLRSFLNKLASEKKAFLLVRSLKVSNSQEFAPPKNPEVAKINEPGLFPPGETLERAGGNPKTGSGESPATGDSGSPYVFGDEHVIVQMTVDLVSVVPSDSNTEAKQP
jgi:hypothetical protein